MGELTRRGSFQKLDDEKNRSGGLTSTGGGGCFGPVGSLGDGGSCRANSPTELEPVEFALRDVSGGLADGEDGSDDT